MAFPVRRSTICAAVAAALGVACIALALALALTRARGRVLSLEHVSASLAPDAVCNDGSRAAFHIARSGRVGSRLWLIYLQSGFQCWSNESCACRAALTPGLTSSAAWPRTLRLGGLFQQLRSFHAVSVGYCSSDAWLGDVSAAESANGWHFRGRAILEGVLAQLAETHGLARASRVLVSGCSAGARGALYNLDAICAAVGALAPGAACTGVIDSGWWSEVDARTDEQRARGVPSLRAVAAASASLYGASGAGGGAAAAGAAALSAAGSGAARRPVLTPSPLRDPRSVCGGCATTPGARARCLFGRACARSTTASFFLSHSQADSFAAGLASGVAPAGRARGWPAGSAAAAAAARLRGAYVREWAEVGAAAASGAGRGAGGDGSGPGRGLTGLFAPACYQHCTSLDARWWRVRTQAGGGGHSAAEALATWLRTGAVHALATCAASAPAGGVRLCPADSCAFEAIPQLCMCPAAPEPAEGSALAKSARAGAAAGVEQHRLAAPRRARRCDGDWGDDCPAAIAC